MTSYGRGLHLEAARVSLAMEIVERISSFADIRDSRIAGRIHGGEIRTAHAALAPVGNQQHLKIPPRLMADPHGAFAAIEHPRPSRIIPAGSG
jgi:ribosomal protein S12 methylthiotransferase accessory factor YcaO